MLVSIFSTYLSISKKPKIRGFGWSLRNAQGWGLGDPTHRTKMAANKFKHILAADFLWIYFTNWQESKKPKTRGFSWSFNGMRKVGV